jgi:hypothetical protein
MECLGGGSESETLSCVIGRAIDASRGPSLLPCLLIPAPRTLGSHTVHDVLEYFCCSPRRLDHVRQGGENSGADVLQSPRS